MNNDPKNIQERHRNIIPPTMRKKRRVIYPRQCPICGRVILAIKRLSDRKIKYLHEFSRGQYWDQGDGCVIMRNGGRL